MRQLEQIALQLLKFVQFLGLLSNSLDSLKHF